MLFKKAIKSSITILPFLFLLFACKHKPDSVPQPLPSALSYDPNSISLVQGTGGNSVAPLFSGEITEFSLQSSPSSGGNLTIDENGVINIAPATPTGTYQITVKASNSAGTSTFTNAYTVTITALPIAISNLAYNPDSLVVFIGTADSSVAPTFDGTSPVTFNLSSAPANPGISISSSGKIKVTNNISVGTYFVTVNATNSTGTSTFNSVFKIRIKDITPANLVYSPNSITMIVGNTASTSSAPTCTGSNLTYSILSPTNPDININSATGAITTNNGLSIGSYPITVQVSNSAATVNFSNVYTVQVDPTPTAPSNLNYSPTTITLIQGNSGSSSTPTVSGTNPITYSFSSTPSSGGNITINSNTGVISATSALAVGTYTITVLATNTVNTTTFTDIYTITVDPAIALTNLSYSPSSATTKSGTAVSSGIPSISGSTPVTYSIANSPHVGITINSSTGVITAASTVSPGVYQLDINATNGAGTVAFTQVFTFTVTAISFAADVQSIIQSNCGGCHSGFTNYAGASGNVNNILNRIQRAQGSPGFMPNGGSPLSTNQINIIKQWQTDGLQP